MKREDLMRGMSKLLHDAAYTVLRDGPDLRLEETQAMRSFDWMGWQLEVKIEHFPRIIMDVHEGLILNRCKTLEEVRVLLAKMVKMSLTSVQAASWYTFRREEQADWDLMQLCEERGEL